MANRLATATSPYLLQHAENPVDWWPWGQDAFAEACRRDVPIFLSIGYAACHWCHVMAHESFSDPAVAGLLNDRFVSIKVDREERPDVDAIYMDVTVALTGHGGWPMSVWLTPDGHAFHAGTYFPPAPQPGMPSFTQVLDAVTEAWRERREQVLEGAETITAQLTARTRAPAPQVLTPAEIDQAIDLLASEADQTHGGFGGAPKFPPSTILEALLRRSAHGDGPMAERAWQLAVDALEAMARGGLYDQLGGGFARYSVDAGWVVPHFEKMLYDNALLIGVYARASAQARRRGDTARIALTERVVSESVAWLLREMLTPEGGFASSLDADSTDAHGHSREGAFYVWRTDDLIQLLGQADGARAAALLGVTEAGSFEQGTSVLQLRDDPDDPRWFAQIRERLARAREDRSRPARDDKVVAAWNGWAIVALVDAAVLLGRPEWLDAAQRAASLLRQRHLHEGRLARTSRDGTPSPAPGTAEDYAGVAHGFLSLAAAIGEAAWLEDALALLRTLDERFQAPDGGLFDSADDVEQLVRRPRDLPENATPSGSSAALPAYRAAYRMTGDAHWRERADAVARTLAALVPRAPRAAGWALADAIAEDGVRAPVEVAIVGAGSEEMVQLAWRESPPGSVVVTGSPDSGIPLLTARPPQHGAATAYVCRGHVCELPVTSLDALRAQLSSTSD